jgi:hypothetical protein
MGLYKFKAFFGVCKKWMLPGSDTENSSVFGSCSHMIIDTLGIIQSIFPKFKFLFIILQVSI